jgi:hypothetical protein
MSACHQTELLPGHAPHLQRFPLKLAGEWVQRPHDVNDRAIAVQGCYRGAPTAVSAGISLPGSSFAMELIAVNIPCHVYTY